MKKILYFVILLIVFSLTSGCYPLSPNYSQQDAELISQKGSALMKEWLEKNMPDAQLRECNADSLMSMVDGNKYLTGYAYGSIEDKDKIIQIPQRCISKWIKTCSMNLNRQWHHIYMNVWV